MRTPELLSTLRVLLPVLGLLLPLRAADAQMSGARGGLEASRVTETPTLDHEAVENYITIEGKAETRVEPTAIRIVLALMVEEKDASGCQAACRKLEEAFLKALADLGITGDAVAPDFISILPIYEWQIETREGKSVAVETRSGFRIQSNVHVRVETDEQARTVLAAAFKLGISNIIAFDYWNKEIDRHKTEARKQALRVAKEKANLLLTAFFEDPPPPVNLHESTRVVYPRSLYHSFENTYAQELTIPWSGDRMPRLKAARPKNTYYRGLFEETDVQGEGLPLRPQISVVSTVRLYYVAPMPEKEEDDD